MKCNTHNLLVLALLVLSLAACSTDAAPDVNLETAEAGETVSRYFDAANSNHFTLVFPSPIDLTTATFEGVLRRDAAGNRGTVRVYGCRAGGDNFVSRDPNCEGQERTTGRISDFSVFISGGSGRVAIYRCLVNGGGDHFVSRDPGCEGQISEGLIGHLLN